MSHYTDMKDSALLEQKENAIELLEYMKKGKWYKADGLVSFAFDMANLCTALTKLNKELINRNLQSISFPEEFLDEAKELFKRDESYDVNFVEFKELVPIKLIQIELPNWF